MLDLANLAAWYVWREICYNLCMKNKFEKLIKLYFAGVLAVLTIFLSPAAVLAHSTGQSLNFEGEKYKVDIGYDSQNVSPKAGKATAFDFALIDKATKKPAHFGLVTVDITLAGEPVFYGDIPAGQDGGADLVFVFPKGGEYKLVAYFKDNSQILQQATFNLSASTSDYEQAPGVASREDKSQAHNFALGALSGVVVLGVIGFIWKFARRAKPAI